MKIGKAILIFLTSSTFASSTWAFTLIAPQLKGWVSTDVPFSLNPTNCPANVRAMVESSMTLWNSISESNLKVSLETDSLATIVEANSMTAAEAAVIVCDPNFSTTFGGSDAAGNADAIGNSQNKLYKGRVVLNVDLTSSGNIQLYPEVTIKVVIAHEIGHVLGLGHSSDSASLMHYTSGNKIDFALNEDDANGIIYLYGRNELNKDNVLGGCGTVHQKPPSGSHLPPLKNILALLALLFFPLLIWKKKGALADAKKGACHHPAI